jgi:TatD DNase family protein
VQFFNLHTHQFPGEYEQALVNLSWPFTHGSNHHFYSTGVHPWHLKQDLYHTQLSELNIIAASENIRAIGECGLDRICETPFALQEKAFRDHIRLAQTLGKPLIIHCVRSFREVMFMLKEERFTLPVVFHGFNNNSDIAHELLTAGYYLSFGKSLFNPSMAQTFASIPNHRFFLETDNSSHSLLQIYQQAAMLRQSSIDQILKPIQSLASQLFQISF